MGKTGRAAVVIFSDGVPDNSDAGLQAGQLLVRDYPDVCIHAVQTGDDPEGYAFLNALTSMTNCGSFRTAASIGSGAEVQQFARAVMITPGIAPVAAGPGPCAGVIRMRTRRGARTARGSSATCDRCWRWGCPPCRSAGPSSSASFGFGSNESTCDTPPSMKQKMTFLARGAKWGAPTAASAAYDRSASKAESESIPKPHADEASHFRRVSGAGRRPGQQA